jgi:hypothetical protein
LGLELAADVEIRVWDSNAEIRYLVLPERPAGTEDLDEQQLAALVTRDGIRSLPSRASTRCGREIPRPECWRIALALGMPVFFCDRASPWQRPSNENTNGLLHQYFPKGTDLRLHSAEQLAAVAAELNDRPRKTLGWDTPSVRLGAWLPSGAGHD